MKKKKKIHCKLGDSGFVSQTSRLMMCLIKGYYTKTLVIIKVLYNNYLDASNKTWDEFILPISEACQPNHLLEYEINHNDLITLGLGMSQLTLLLILNKFIRFKLK